MVYFSSSKTEGGGGGGGGGEEGGEGCELRGTNFVCGCAAGPDSFALCCCADRRRHTVQHSERGWC